MIAIVMMVLVGNFAYAEEPANEVVDLAQDISTARANLQIGYALKMGQKTLKFIDDYQAQHQTTVSGEIVDRFTDGLLKHGEDPIIETISYGEQVVVTMQGDDIVITPIPEQLVILMHSSNFVEPTLHGEKFIYSFVEKAWESENSNDPISEPIIGPCESQFSYCMGVITKDCHTIEKKGGYACQKNILKPGRVATWSDTQWCPAWLDYVGTLPQ